MSEQRQFPIDEMTGVPYPLLTLGNAKEIPFLGVTNHHHTNYPRQDPNLEGKMVLSGSNNVLRNLDVLSLEKLGGLAVRVSRTQRVVPGLHQLTHNRFPKGPTLPDNVHDKFVTAVKNCAGVVPREAIDATAPEGHELIRMSSAVFDMVVHPWNLHVEKYCYDRPQDYQKQVLGSFFLRYAEAQDISHISPCIIDEFLHTTNSQRRLRQGRFILREAMEVSVAPVIPQHRELQRMGLTQGITDIRSAVWGNIPKETIPPVLAMLAARLAG